MSNNPHAVTPFLPPQDEYRRVVDLATRLASTAFVPKGLRGEPESVLAAMLVGRELGIGALESLRSIHVIEGRPTESAELLHALVLRAGHDLYVAESSSDRCVVRYRRAGWPANRQDAEVEWTMQDARDANLASKDVWKRYPRAMLRSRAVSEAVRQGFPDVVKGAGYVAEELEGPDDLLETQAAATVTVEDTVRVEPHPGTPTLDDDEDEADVRRRLYERARAAYRRIVAAEPDVAAHAWQAATTGPWGKVESAADVFRVGDVLVLEQRVADLEAVADDEGGPEDATPAEPDPTPDSDDGGTEVDGNGDPIVDAEVVEPGDEHGEPSPDPDDTDVEVTGPDTEPEPEPDPNPGDEDRAAAEAGRSIEEPAEPEKLTERDAVAAWATLNVATSLAVLKGTPTDVEVDGRTIRLDLSDVNEETRRTVVRRWEHKVYPDKPRRTITSQVGHVEHVPGTANSADASGSRVSGGDEPAGTEPTADPATAEPVHAGTAAHTFTQPDDMDAREWSDRMALWRRYEAARKAVELEGEPARREDALDRLRQLQAVQVGTDPGGALYVSLQALEVLASSSEAIAAEVVPF